MHPVLRNTLMEIYPEADTSPHSTTKFQDDGYNCGPWTIFLLQEYIQNGILPNPDHLDINATRQTYRNILDLILTNNIRVNQDTFNDTEDAAAISESLTDFESQELQKDLEQIEMQEYDLENIGTRRYYFPLSNIISQPIFKPINIDNQWFNDDEMNTLLRNFFVNRSDIRLFDAIDALQHGGKTLGDNLRNAQLLPTETNIVVPINLGNLHWAGLYINFHQEHNQAPIIYYIDPIGEDMHPILKNTIMEIYPKAVISYSDTKFQDDGYNCGSWTIFLLQEYIHHGILPNPSHLDINVMRQIYRNILDLTQPNNIRVNQDNSTNTENAVIGEVSPDYSPANISLTRYANYCLSS